MAENHEESNDESPDELKDGALDEFEAMVGTNLDKLASTPATGDGEIPAFAAEKPKLIDRLLAPIRGLVGGLWDDFFKVTAHLLDPDRATRMMAWVFLVSVIGVFFVGGVGIQRYRALREWRAKVALQAEQDRKQMGEYLQKQAEDARRKGSVTSLGRFQFELVKQPDERPSRFAFYQAELDFDVQCDSVQTCQYIEKNLGMARDQIIGSFTSAFEREELMSREGKSRIKRVIINKLNGWLPRGKVEDVFLSRLVLG